MHKVNKTEFRFFIKLFIWSFCIILIPLAVSGCGTENTQDNIQEVESGDISNITQDQTDPKPELYNTAYEKLCGYWVTPATGGGGRYYYLYIKPDNVATEGEVVARSVYPEATWFVDSVEDNGDIHFHVTGTSKTVNYTYSSAEQKITSIDRELVSVDDGKTKYQFYMTRKEAPADLDSWAK